MLKKDKVKKTNTNISLETDLKKDLQIYAILSGKTLSGILCEAGQAYLRNTGKVVNWKASEVKKIRGGMVKCILKKQIIQVI